MSVESPDEARRRYEVTGEQNLETHSSVDARPPVEAYGQAPGVLPPSERTPQETAAQLAIEQAQGTSATSVGAELDQVTSSTTEDEPAGDMELHRLHAADLTNVEAAEPPDEPDTQEPPSTPTAPPPQQDKHDDLMPRRVYEGPGISWGMAGLVRTAHVAESVEPQEDRTSTSDERSQDSLPEPTAAASQQVERPRVGEAPERLAAPAEQSTLPEPGPKSTAADEAATVRAAPAAAADTPVESRQLAEAAQPTTREPRESGAARPQAAADAPVDYYDPTPIPGRPAESRTATGPTTAYAEEGRQTPAGFRATPTDGRTRPGTEAYDRGSYHGTAMQPPEATAGTAGTPPTETLGPPPRPERLGKMERVTREYITVDPEDVLDPGADYVSDRPRSRAGTSAWQERPPKPEVRPWRARVETAVFSSSPAKTVVKGPLLAIAALTSPVRMFTKTRIRNSEVIEHPPGSGSYIIRVRMRAGRGSFGKKNLVVRTYKVTAPSATIAKLQARHRMFNQRASNA